MESIKCKICGRPLKNEESIKIGMGKKCYRVFKLQQSALQETNDLVEMKQKWNQLSLKNSVLEKKITKLETMLKSIMESGVQISDQLTNNTEAIERIKQERNEVKSAQEISFMVVIKELKMVFSNGVKLEKVPESFLSYNRKSIYLNELELAK